MLQNDYFRQNKWQPNQTAQIFNDPYWMKVFWNPLVFNPDNDVLPLFKFYKKIKKTAKTDIRLWQ